MWFNGVEVAQETSAPPPKKNPGSAHGKHITEIIEITERSLFKNYAVFNKKNTSLNGDSNHRLFNTAYISVFTFICKFHISDFTAVKHDCLYFFSFLIFFFLFYLKEL